MSTILVHDADGIRTVTLNRPDRRNALTPEMQNELIATLDEAAASDSIRLLILTGAGEAFCAGLDLSALQTMADKSAFEHADDAHRISRMFRTLFELPIPTIAQVNGHAIAGGTGLATLCDFTLAAPTAKFAYTEARIGFVPALVSAYLTLQIGDKRARDLLLTARFFSADEACAFGLVTEVVPAEELANRVQALATTLLANSPTSLRATKLLLAEQNRAWLDHALDVSMQANAASRQTHDFREGIAAFLEKRHPAWNATKPKSTKL
jgi:methylglutaconyl-CoA hydratase